MTADELHALPNGKRYELVRGELRTMSPTDFPHGEAAAAVAASLFGHVRQRRLGKVYINTGFWIGQDPDTVRGPDIAFVRTERVVKSEAFYDGPPDLAIEIVSSSDTYMDFEEKLDDLLRGGTRAVVVVDPARQRVRIHRVSEIVDVTEAIAVDDVVPGWSLPMSEIFEDE